MCVLTISKDLFFIASCYLILKPGFCACPEKSCRVRGTILCTCGSRCSSRIWQLTKSRTTSWENILCIILKNAQVHLFSLSIKIQTELKCSGVDYSSYYSNNNSKCFCDESHQQLVRRWVQPWSSVNDCIVIMNGANLSSHRVTVCVSVCDLLIPNSCVSWHTTIPWGRPLVFVVRPGEQEQWSKTMLTSDVTLSAPHEYEGLKSVWNGATKFTALWLIGKSHLICSDWFKKNFF